MTPSIASRAMQRDYPDHRCPSEPERIGDPRQGWHGFSNGDGHEAAILNATYLEPACGCRVVGAGTLQHPIMVEPCEAHAAAMYPTLAEPTDALDRIAANLPVSYGELAAVDPARCPSSPDRRGPHRPDDTTDALTCAECGQDLTDLYAPGGRFDTLAELIERGQATPEQRAEYDALAEAIA